MAVKIDLEAWVQKYADKLGTPDREHWEEARNITRGWAAAEPPGDDDATAETAQ